MEWDNILVCLSLMLIVFVFKLSFHAFVFVQETATDITECKQISNSKITAVFACGITVTGCSTPAQ